MISRFRPHLPLIAFLLIASTLGGSLAYVFFGPGDKSLILPGTTTSGHYQIELQCGSCHTNEETANVFTSSGVPNSACNTCHGEDLKAFSDSHPVRKFRNPENAVFTENIDPLNCITCHREHDAKLTGDMGVTLPADYCAHCHQVTLDNLESHQNLRYDSCSTAGCHNYHDNIALAPSFLLKHFARPAVLSDPVIPPTDPLARWIAAGNPARAPLTPAEHDAPAAAETDVIDGWYHSSHAAAGINCSECHGGPREPSWVARPKSASCQSCHDFEYATFLKGKHGMRQAHTGLSPMTPAMARQPMKTSAAHRELDCNACHQAHDYDRRFASHQACIECHDDNHTRSYESSAHHRLWLAETSGTAPPGSGVSCATCHMPAVEHEGHRAINHDQNANLRPNEKMLRSVCMDCHGLQFAMSALADVPLIQANFNRHPAEQHPGISWSVESAVERGDTKIIDLKRYIEANPGKTRSDHSPTATDPD